MTMKQVQKSAADNLFRKYFEMVYNAGVCIDMY